jgi:hypothetical protein
MSDVMRYGRCISWILLVMWLWTPSAHAQSAPHSSEDLSARATDPTAALMSFGFAIGPAIGAVKPLTPRLLVGAFSQNLFAAHVGISQIQPVITYQLGHGWAVSAGDAQFTYDWERDEWTNVPLGVQIGVVRIVAKQPFRFYVNPQWNFKDLSGAVKSKWCLVSPCWHRPVDLHRSEGWIRD